MRDRAARLVFFLLGTGLFAAGCKPDLGDPPSLVKHVTVLGIRAEGADEEMIKDGSLVRFAEAHPGQAMRYQLLVASPSGTVADARASVDLCRQPKPPAESNSVSGACVSAEPSAPTDMFDAKIPADVCMLFGPITPPAMAGEPTLRPRDPDATGGYYQPVRFSVAAPGDQATRVAFSLTRVECNLASAPAEVIQQFSAEYQRNINPKLDGLVLPGMDTLTVKGAAAEGEGMPVTFEVHFAPDSAEQFPWFDPTTRTLKTRREALSLSWFVTAGALSSDRTGRAEDAPGVTSTNEWTPPVVTAPTTVFLWLVLRDSRGGVDFASHSITVNP